MAEVVDGPLPDLSFFEMDVVRICGHDARALGHDMAATLGVELFGHSEFHDQVLADVLAAGEQYGIRQLGSKAYKPGSGWLVGPLPAIYESDALSDYRQWLAAAGTEAQFSLGGSFVSDDVTDYSLVPLERGQDHPGTFDHDFIGREANEARADEPHRERVTSVWNAADVVAVYASLFEAGETEKFVDLPDTANTWSMTHDDTVQKDGEMVGLSKYPGYRSDRRAMRSLGTIDPEYSDPGTAVTFVRGDTSAKRRVERQEQTKIRATVGPAPSVTGGRESLSFPSPRPRGRPPDRWRGSLSAGAGPSTSSLPGMLPEIRGAVVISSGRLRPSRGLRRPVRGSGP